MAAAATVTPATSAASIQAQIDALQAQQVQMQANAATGAPPQAGNVPSGYSQHGPGGEAAKPPMQATWCNVQNKYILHSFTVLQAMAFATSMLCFATMASAAPAMHERGYDNLRNIAPASQFVLRNENTSEDIPDGYWDDCATRGVWDPRPRPRKTPTAAPPDKCYIGQTKEWTPRGSDCAQQFNSEMCAREHGRGTAGTGRMPVPVRLGSKHKLLPRQEHVYRTTCQPRRYVPCRMRLARRTRRWGTARSGWKCSADAARRKFYASSECYTYRRSLSTSCRRHG